MAELKGLVPGGEKTSHASGNDITYTIQESGTKVKIEGDEYHLCASSLQSEKVHEFKNMTSKQVLDKLYDLHHCDITPGIANTGDFIVCKIAVRNPEKRNWTGTVKELLNVMQSKYGCNLAYSGKEKYDTGGPVSVNAPKSAEEIASMHNVNPEYIRYQSEIGTESEMKEHGCDRNTAYILTMHHLELNPDCYCVNDFMSGEQMNAGGLMIAKVLPKAIQNSRKSFDCGYAMYQKYGKGKKSFTEFMNVLKQKGPENAHFWNEYLDCVQKNAEYTAEIAGALAKGGEFDTDDDSFGVVGYVDLSKELPEVVNDSATSSVPVYDINYEKKENIFQVPIKVTSPEDCKTIITKLSRMDGFIKDGETSFVTLLLSQNNEFFGFIKKQDSRLPYQNTSEQIEYFREVCASLPRGVIFCTISKSTTSLNDNDKRAISIGFDSLECRILDYVHYDSDSGEFYSKESNVSFANGGGISQKKYEDLSQKLPSVISDSGNGRFYPSLTVVKKGIHQLNSPIKVVNSSRTASQIFYSFWNKGKIGAVEEFCVMYMNSRNKPIGLMKHSLGGISGTVVEAIIITAVAVKLKAKNVIVCHNHPSGNASPSQPDIKISKKLKTSLMLVGCTLVDSMIVFPESENYTSLADDLLLAKGGNVENPKSNQSSLFENGGTMEIAPIKAYRYYVGDNAFLESENPQNKYGKGVYFCTNSERFREPGRKFIEVTITPKNPMVFEASHIPNMNYVRAMRESGFTDKNEFNNFIFSSGHDAIIIKHSEIWGDEIILPGPGCVSSMVMIDERMKSGGTAGKMKFDKNDIPSKRIYDYTQILKENYPKVWALGGNVFGNKAYKNLERVIKRGYWLESEEWMYVKWKSFVARHAGDFLIAGIIANLKWMVFPARGAEYSKEVVREEIMKRYPEKEILLKDGGKIEGGEYAEVVNGFYSPIEKRLSETKIEKQSANKWLAVIGKGDEATWTGIREWLESKNPQEAVSKSEIQQWLKDNRIEIVEVVKGSYSKELESLYEELEAKNKGRNFGDWASEDQDEWMSKRGEPQDTKYSQYQLEGDKENYKEVLVTLPSKSDNKLPDGFYVTENPITTSSAKKYIVVDIEGQRYGSADTKELAIKDFNNKHHKTAGVFKSSHFDELNILVHLRMNTRTDADGNKILFIEELQSDWGQLGKRDGFITESEKRQNEIFEKDHAEFQKLQANIQEERENLRVSGQHRQDIEDLKSFGIHTWSGLPEFGDRKVYTKSENKPTRDELISESDLPEEFKNIRARVDKAAEKLRSLEKRKSEIVKKYGIKYEAFGESSLIYPDSYNKGEIPSAPFVTDTNAWVKLGLKVALKEAVKQGVKSIAWTTGEQQNDRYDLSATLESVDVTHAKNGEKIVYIIAKNNSDGAYKIDANGKILESGRNNLTGNVDGKNLEDVIGKDLTNKILQAKHGEKLSGEDFKVQGKGMTGFYGSPTQGSLGIVGNVAKSLFKQEVKTTQINTLTEKDIYWEGNLYKIRGLEGRAWRNKDLALEWVKEYGHTETQIQYAIDITPELKAEIESGLPLFMHGGTLDEGVVQNTDKAAEILARVQELTDTVDGYRKISLDPDDEVRLTLRIKDRKGTKDEKGSEDYFLSIVITDKVHISHPDNDELKQDEEEFVFGSEYTPSEIVEFINGKINECQREEGIEDCPRMMETGGHVGSDTVTMNVPLLIRVFELVREDVKDDRELHFMAERILDIARKGTLTMEDYDYIAGTLEKPEIQEAIADAGYEVQEMADGGMMNKYAICTASLGRKYGMQRSLWDEETMDKYERCLDSVEKRMDDGGSVSNPSLDQKVKQYKELAHAGKTASEILEEIGVDEGVYGENNKEYTDFYLALAASDLSGKKFPKKARLTPVKLEGVEIPLKLKEKNVKITGIGNKDDILQLLKNIVGDDALRPALQGVYFDEKNKSAVATDSMKMVVIPDKSIKKSEIINPIDGNVIDGKYPDWKMVIPDYGKEDAVRVNVQYMLNVLHTVLNSAGYLDISPFVVMLHKGEQFACNAHVMYPVFEVMAKMGFDEVTLYLNSPRRSFLIKPDSGEVTGLVMPLLLSAFHYTFPGIYTILENGKEVQSFSGRIKTEPTEREIREFMESLTILSDAGDTDAAELLESFKIIYA